MQRADGAVYHKVSGMHWPGMILPEEDTQPRYVFGLSTYGTAMFAGATAMAARIYEPWDAQYAAVLLEHAERAQSYLERNPNSQFLKSAHQDDGSGGYEKSGDRGERFWAAAELLKTTGEKRYADYLEKHFSAQFQQAAESISWISGLSLGQFAYATSEAGHPERQAELRSRFAEAADAIVRRVENNGYYYSLHADEYTWASAKNGMAKAQLLLLANELEADPVYEKTALEQLHYTLGRNVNGTTYLTGAGHVMPMNPHHRMKESTGVYIPGLLVGGPNKFGGDPVLDQLLRDESPPPAKAYIDHVGSYATNEYAIDYNAPLVFVLAYFVP